MEENQTVLPGNDARGWNDPPQFLYNAQKQAGTINKDNPLATNKRVGHDLGNVSKERSTSNVLPEGMAVTPQLGLNPVPILNMPQNSAKPVSSDETTPNKELVLPDIKDDDEMCVHCVKCFIEASERLKEAQLVDERLCKDITKRVTMFEQSWKSGKLSAAAKPKCLRLACALAQKLYTTANEMHLQLMTDHISEVSQWMVGVKKLIQAGLESNR